MSNRVSIILTCFNSTRLAKHMSQLAIDHIRKFTDRKDYELIIMDPEPKFALTDPWNSLDLEGKDTKHMVLSQDPGYTACMNIGADKAKHDILVFMQNDVFVHEGWLEGLVWYIKNGWEAVFPDQVYRTREYVKATYERDFDDLESMKGGRDAGLIMITKEAFKRTGGWNADLGLLAERDFYERMGKANVVWTETNKVLITHIMAGTNIEQLDRDPETYNERMKKDADLLNTPVI